MVSLIILLLEERTYQHCKFLANLGCDEAKYKPTDSDAGPKAGGYYTRFKLSAGSLSPHKRHNPTTNGDSSSNVAKEKERCNPCNAAFQCLSKAALTTCIRSRVSFAINTTG